MNAIEETDDAQAIEHAELIEQELEAALENYNEVFSDQVGFKLQDDGSILAEIYDMESDDEETKIIASYVVKLDYFTAEEESDGGDADA